MRELPLACSLDAEGGARQGERYAALGRSLVELERDGLRLMARFGPDLDEELLREAVATERGCCSFLEIRSGSGTLELRAPSPEEAPVLDAIADALGAEPASR